jgi:hypothetical protein
MEAQVPVEPMGSMLFKGTNVHLHVDGAELRLELPKSPKLPKIGN